LIRRMPPFRMAERERETDGKLGLLRLPQGLVDPLFAYELAERLHMSVGELGQRMSLHELTVGWPAYYASKKRMADREQAKQVR